MQMLDQRDRQFHQLSTRKNLTYVKKFLNHDTKNPTHEKRILTRKKIRPTGINFGPIRKNLRPKRKKKINTWENDFDPREKKFHSAKKILRPTRRNFQGIRKKMWPMRLHCRTLFVSLPIVPFYNFLPWKQPDSVLIHIYSN